MSKWCATSETAVKKAILQALAYEPDLAVWPNNVGMKGHVHYGLGPGSADIIGLLQLSSCKHRPCDRSDGTHFYSAIGRFIAIEVKRDAKRKPEAHQSEWLESVRRLGGFAAVVWDVDSARAAIGRARLGERQ